MFAKPGDRAPAARPPVAEDAVAAVFARAAELDLERSPGAPQVHLDEEALVEIGVTVGLSPEAVRRAVAEHHAGALVPAPSPPTTWVGPRIAVAERRIEGEAAPVRHRIGRDLERQWFRRVRDQGERSVWSARNDLPARVARKVDFRHRLVLQGVSGIVLTTIDCAGDGVDVRLEADLADRRHGLGWVVAAASVGGATAGGILALLGGLDPALVIALPSAGVGGGGALALARRTYLVQVRRLADDLEGILDRHSHTRS